MEMMRMNTAKRLYRSRSNRTIAGVCAGIADYFGWDPTLVRIGWIVLTFFGGSGILIYFVLWLVVPEAS
jgi:phage shock protein C